jgi:hydroxymethylpyrimidine pyrophosphatase-like HAD family hydrolase
MHGGLVIDVTTGEHIYSRTFDTTEVDALLSLTTELGLPTLLCYPHGFRTNALTQEVIDLFVPYNEPLPELVPELAALRSSAPHKVAVWTGDDGYEAMLARATERVAGRWTITSGDNRSLEFLPHGVNKAHATEALARWLGLDLAQVAAVGDGTNDIELLAEVGRSVAMRHARPEVRAAASFSIPDHLPDDAASAISLLYPELVPGAAWRDLEAAGR